MNNPLMKDFYLFVILVVVFIVLIDVIFAVLKRFKSSMSINSHKFISHTFFEDNWITKNKKGFKYNNESGCYIITIFDKPRKNNFLKGYENIYIGQSVNICQRVHSHFTGKGNGDVYADIKYGKYAYVQLIPCSKNDMNSLEKKLIKKHNATQSYNKTKGGA